MNAKGKYHTVVIKPTCYVGELDNNDVLFLWTEIPGATSPRGTSMLRNIQIIDYDDAGADIDLFFSQTKDADATVTGALGAASSIGNLTDAEVRTLKPLTRFMIDYSGITSGEMHNFTQGYTGYYSANSEGVNSSWLRGFPVWSHEATQAQIDAGNANPGSIYVMAEASATKTYSANGITLALTFES